MSFSKLDLSDQLVQGIRASGYTAPTPIQSRAIPPAVAGRDIIGVAQTGTGKTAAFALPMLDRLSQNAAGQAPRHVRALVLTPTRELAQQVEQFITGYARFTQLEALSIIGGVSMENQVKRLRRGIDIIVATPGRLNDHLDRRTADISNVEILVLDEADRRFDMGFIHEVRKIIARVPAKRQTMLFSATMSKEVKALTASIQKNPELIEVGEQRRPVETVAQTFYSVPQELKLELLNHLLASSSIESALVFSRTKHGADKITRRLERNGVASVAIHSNRSQPQRERALAGFKEGKYRVLVATDIAARGIDVEGISHVVNYDTPRFAEDYIHRIGRTGRAEATGDAITFVSPEEEKFVKSIERHVGRRISVGRCESFDYTKKETLPAGFQNRQSSHPVHHRRTAPAKGTRRGESAAGRHGNDRGTKPARHAARPWKNEGTKTLRDSSVKPSTVATLESTAPSTVRKGWKNLFGFGR